MIRKARIADVPRMAALWRKLMEFHIARTGPMLALAGDAERRWRAFAAKNIRSRNGLVLMAEDGGGIVGYSLNHIKPNIPVYRVRKLGHMGDLYVLESHRKRGIASAFRKEAFRWFRSKGVRYASIAVHSINPDARAIYLGWGFREHHIEMRMRL